MNYRKKRKIKKNRHQVLLSRKGNKTERQLKRRKQGRILNKSLLSSSQRIVSIKDVKLDNEFCPQILLEYSSLFPGEVLDINDEIRNFPREQLLKIVSLLGRNFGNYKISDLKEKPFFSYNTYMYRVRMDRIAKYINQNNYSSNTVSYASERTLLEFLKLTFSAQPEECSAKYEDSMAEVKIFDLLLSINEQKVTPFNGSQLNPNNLAQIMFVAMYATNEFTNYDWKLALAEQMYYARSFFEFITSRNEYSAFYQQFLLLYEINDWKEYFRTIALLSAQAGQYGTGVFDLKKNDPEGLVNRNVLSRISINELETISVDDNANDKNRDFIAFRSHPIIYLQDGTYMIYNSHLLTERLYNSIYFDLLPYNKELKYRKKLYSQFYKEVFVEKYLFDNTLISCLREDHLTICFPKFTDVQRVNFVDLHEESEQPDFYFREKDSSFIFECKAIKLNGDLKRNADVDAIMNVLENKLVGKRWELNDGERQYLPSQKKEGVGQLVSHIEKLENKSFVWDSQIPDSVLYYPILVLESHEILQRQLSAIVNEWYFELLNLVPSIKKEKCQPLIVMSIHTLFLYSDHFKRDGLKYYLDKFISACKRTINGKIQMTPLESFDGWMKANFKSNKQCYYEETIKMLHY